MMIRRPRAFTLIELIVVIVVLGVLAALAVPTFSSVQDKAAKKSLDATLVALVREARVLSTSDRVSVAQRLHAAVADLPAGTAAWADESTRSVLVSRGGVVRRLTLSPDGSSYTLTDDPATSVYATAVMADAPRGFWRFDDPASALDSSGNGNTGAYRTTNNILTGGTTADGGKALNAAAVTDGSYAVSVPHSASIDLTTASLTVEAWFRPDVAMSSMPTYPVIALKRPWPNAGYAMHLHQSGGYVIQSLPGGGAVYSTGGTTVFEPGRWYHLVGVRDGANMFFYINGRLVSRATHTTLPTASTTDPLGIGASVVGAIDDVSVYASALSAQQVMAHYKAAGK